MLDQLVESSSGDHGNARRGGFLLTTMIVVVSLFLGAMLYSLFAKDYGMGGSDLELSTLVAPVPVPEEEPPPPEPDEPKPKEQKAAPNADVRKEIIQAMDESPKEPEKISVEKSNIPARRPDVYTVRGDNNLDANSPAPSTYKGPVSTNNQGIPGPGGKPNTGEDTGGDDPPPPPVPKPTPPPVPKKVSLGVINGKASRLVTPPYPAAAKAVRAAGAVNVSVSIDVNGNVTSANAVSGHPLLRAAAEQAARASKFTPTVLSGVAVPVTGIIVYNFVAQ
jgi:TonB family protein